MTPSSGIVLAAGFGTRMRPLTDDRPKALVSVAGHTLLDHAVLRLVRAGVTRVVVNVHYMADMVEAHLAGPTRAMLAALDAEPAEIVVSDERSEILETGGGVKAALPLLGDDPFFVTNVDSLWIEDGLPNLDRLAAQPLGDLRARVLLAPIEGSLGFDGRGDFLRDDGGHLERPAPGEPAPFAYPGTLLTSGAAFRDMPDGRWSLNRMFDAALTERALLGTPMGGLWMHVGTPGAVDDAERAIAAQRA